MSKNNLQKTPKSAQIYYDVLLKQGGKELVFENEDNILLLTIGYAETTWKLIQRFKNSKNIYIIDRKSECDWLKAFCEIHNITNVHFTEIEEESEVLDSLTILFDNKELSNKNMIVIMNPPYSGNLFLKITEKVLETNPAQVIMLGPVRWLQDAAALTKKISDWKRFFRIRDAICSVGGLDKYQATQIFGANFDMDLGIYYIKNGKVDVANWGWIKDVFAKDTEIINEVIWDKEKPLEYNELLDKIVAQIKDNIDNHLEEKKVEGWRVRLIPNRPFGKAAGKAGIVRIKFYMTHEKHSYIYHNGYNTNGRYWIYDLEVNNRFSKEWDETTPITYSIPFDTYEEANNFEESTKTNFYRYVLGVQKIGAGVNKRNLPFMNSYKEKWDDKRFYEYFNITEDEQKEIYNFLKKNNVPNLFGEESEGVLWLES